jgi:hypothetical protein
VTVVQNLRKLALGDRLVDGLLHTARLESHGVEFYGEEAIVDCFRQAPVDFSDAATHFETAGHIAIIDGETALIADLYTGAISRLWCLGTGPVALGERSISVAFDPDLAQTRGDVFFAPGDHPALAADAGKRVEAIGGDLARNDRGYRARALLIRAFGNIDRGVALFAQYRLDNSPARTSGFVYVMAYWIDDMVTIVRDAAIAAQPWTPRIGA